MRNNKTFNEIHNEFVKNKDGNEARKIKEIYERVEREYRENKELDIALERVMVKRYLEEYMSWSFKYYIQVMIIILTVFITNIFSNKDVFKEDIMFLSVGFISTIACVFFMMFIDRKSIKKENSKYIYYNICLEILDKLEQEYV